MAYNQFAYWYDALNGEADYDALASQVCALLKGQGIGNGIVADLGCGTGEMTLRLAQAGYDMIAVDASADMLSMVQEKLARRNIPGVLLLCQRLEALDLYGTIRGAVSTFDTFNHLSPADLSRAIEKTSLFLEPGGVLIFDINTPFKHKSILANEVFEIAVPGETREVCLWHNTLLEDESATRIEIVLRRGEETLFAEEFLEYIHPLPAIEKELQTHGFATAALLDGENFGDLRPNSQRALFCAVKQK
ncbi:class I SAM-dependent methyltransferase [Ruminococcaceae bacterium OttesenSCG-928-O06]|nr:class I SAM-dependent methyltransferase [Ruminococcaceae bacterium OttesenSCG-928-O06]